MSQYDALAQRVLSTIARKGAAVLFETTTVVTHDPTTGQAPVGTPFSFVGSAVRTDSNPEILQALGLTVIKSITLLVAAAGLALPPKFGMRLTFAGVTYTVKDPGEFAPDGTPIFYTVVGSL